MGPDEYVSWLTISIAPTLALIYFSAIATNRLLRGTTMKISRNNSFFLLALAAKMRNTDAKSLRGYLKPVLDMLSTNKIVGGSDASLNNYPFFVDLNGCGGSLIHEDVSPFTESPLLYFDAIISSQYLLFR